ncbi:MAG: hypothetical protein ABJC09_02145 [Terriglobia bacterium]
MSSPRVISEPRLAANRQNALHSTGPTTIEGKFRVRLNGLNHGLTGHTILMPYEDAARYQVFIENIIASLRPEGAPEESLARTVADGYWRLNRARAIESNIFALGAAASPAAPLTQARTYLDNACQFQLLTLYEARIDRAIRRSAAELKELQAIRRAAEEKALEEAALLAQLAESKGKAYDPSSDGFGFSKDFLTCHIPRQRRFMEARGHVPGRLKRAA